MVSLPSDIGGVFDIFGLGSSFFSSELAPSLATPTGWFQRVSVLLFAFSLLGFSAAVHPRLDEGSRPSIVLGSIIVLAVSVAFSAVVYLDSKGDISNREQWRTAHDAVSIKALPDMTKIEGTVDIHPGKDLFLDIDVTFKAPDDESIKKAFFTLNPGQKVEGVTASSGTPLQFVNENGLLEIELLEVIAPGHETTVHIIAKGLPDDSFAYLYSAFDLTNSTGIKSGDIPLLGMFPGVFDNSYVALMPGLRWLPMSGPDKNRDDPRLRPVDFYNVDLRVILPEGWLAAGPGRRQETDEKSERSTFRFASTAPVPEVALLASRFESRAMKVE
jgi:hypothetical protein